MYSIDGTNITLTRGDSLSITLDITRDGEAYVPAEGSTIRFAMKEKFTDSDEDVKLVKDIPIDSLTFEIEPEDTKNLVMKKKYVYDIQITDERGKVYTFFNGTIKIGEEVL